MIEIKFRGQRIDTGEFVVGMFLKSNFNSHISVMVNTLTVMGQESHSLDVYAFPVKPETVTQLTGLKDKNGIHLFEMDVYCHNNKNFLVINTLNAGLVSVEINKNIGSIATDYTLMMNHNHRSYNDIKRIEEYINVIGNIYNNPELIQK